MNSVKESLAVAEEIEGQRRGSTLVMADGYLYRRNYTNVKNDKNYLLCNQRYEQPHCYARAILQNGLVKVTKTHNHIADPIKVDQLRMKSRCKKRAEEETTSIREIVEEEQSSGSLDVHPNFYGTLAKRRKNTLPIIPKNIDQFIQSLQENEERFCNSMESSLFFSGFITADDFSVATFISPCFNDVLENVETIHVDRLYSDVPSLYKHLCTILITVNNHVYPLVYGLMTSDSEESYTILFTFVKQQLPSLNFKLAILDYHEPIRNALRSANPLSESCGGFYHYSMAVWREVLIRSLLDAYKENTEFQMCIRMMLSLPILPAEFVEDGFALVEEKVMKLDSFQPDLQEVLVYIQDSWLNNLGTEVFSVASELQRSSLDVDAYLAKLKNKLGNSFKNIWIFIDRLKSFQESERKDFEKLSKGLPNRKKSICLTANSKVKEVVRKLKSKKMELSDVLNNIASQVQPPASYSMDKYMEIHKTSVIPFYRPSFQIILAEIPNIASDTDVE